MHLMMAWLKKRLVEGQSIWYRLTKVVGEVGQERELSLRVWTEVSVDKNNAMTQMINQKTLFC